MNHIFQIAIVGATGAMGTRIAQALLDRGARPVLVLRGGTDHPKAGSLAALVGRGATIRDGDVTRPDTLVAALRGVHTVVSTLQGGPDVIVDGQAALAEAARDAGAVRLFPSDFSIDRRRLAPDDHLLLGWRTAAAERIARTGLEQVNVFNGAFTEMLTSVFSDLIDWKRAEVLHWGPADQPYDFTTMDDAAAYVAEAALDPTLPAGGFEIVGEALTMERLAAVLARIGGRPFTTRSLGTLADLDDEIDRLRTLHPNDPASWVGLQYQRAMAGGAGKLHAPANARYPSIRPTSVEVFLERVHVAESRADEPSQPALGASGPTAADDSADRLAIMDVASRFETTFDRGELDEHMDFWTDGLRFESPYMGTFDNREDYRRALQGFYDELRAKGGTRHLMSNFEIDLAGDEAHVRSYLSVFNRRDGSMLGIVEWQDEMVRTHGEWRYASRKQIA